MTEFGLPVRPGFILTTSACRTVLEHGWSSALGGELAAGVSWIEQQLDCRLGDVPKKSSTKRCDLFVNPATSGVTNRKDLPPMPDDGAPELILHESREKRRQQDSKLQRLLRLATTAPIIALSVGAVAVVVSEPLAASAAVILLLGFYELT